MDRSLSIKSDYFTLTSPVLFSLGTQIIPHHPLLGLWHKETPISARTEPISDAEFRIAQTGMATLRGIGVGREEVNYFTMCF